MSYGDWSSDVCSSDLAALAQPLVHLRGQAGDLLAEELGLAAERLPDLRAERVELLLDEAEPSSPSRRHEEIGRASCRESVCKPAWGRQASNADEPVRR